MCFWDLRLRCLKERILEIRVFGFMEICRTIMNAIVWSVEGDTFEARQFGKEFIKKMKSLTLSTFLSEQWPYADMF
jgi:hypothetical protein